MTDAKSTSARLLDMQAAFAASQADLTAMERQRDEARALNRQLADHLAGAHTGWGKVLAERDEARAEIEELTTTLRIFRNSQSADVIVLRTARDKARDEAKTLRIQLAAAVDATAKAIEDERTRVLAILVSPLLTAQRAIPDGEIRNGCYVLNGAKVRERLRQAYLAIRDGANATPDSPRYPAPGHQEGVPQQ